MPDHEQSQEQRPEQNDSHMAPISHNPGATSPTSDFPTVPPAYGAAYVPWMPPPPVASNPTHPWSKPPWFHISRRTVLIAGLALSLLLVSTGIAAVVVVSHLLSRPDGYLLNSSTNVAFVQFTEDQSQHLTGSLQSVYATSDETVHSESAAFTGIRNGSQISLTFSTLGFSATVLGTLSGDTLILHMPDQNGYVATEVFHAASTADYNTAAAKLRQRISGSAVATQAAQATATEQQVVAQATFSAQNRLDQAITDANNQLSADLNTLNSDTQHLATSTDFSDAIDAYASDWTQMQQDYQQEKSDYQQGCGDNGYNASVVAYDASVVSYDLSTIQYDDSTLSYDEDSVNAALKQVQSDKRTIQADWQNLQAAEAADTTGSISASFSQDDINAAQAKAQQQVDASNKAIQKAQGQGQQYDQEAAQMNTTAQNLANGMNC